MSYIGNEPTSVAFLTDTFSGNGSTTAFTLSAAPAGTSSILVAITGVVQDPSTYSVVGTTLTFSPAPPTGTGNISVRFLGIPASGVTTTAYRTVTEFTATAGQTTFSVPSYTVGFIDVYRNGVMLGSADYTASNGLTVVLASGATAGDLVEVISMQVSSVLNAIPSTAGSVGTANIANGAVTMAKLDSTAQYTGFKNRIINGNMTIDQRFNGAATSVNTGAATTYIIDRMDWRITTGSATVQRSTDAPTGFSNSALFTVTSAGSALGSGDFNMLQQAIEGFNVPDLAYGTSSAETLTLSFWVKSSLATTFSVVLFNNNANPGSVTRSYPANYTITSANTWQRVSVTIPGDTAFSMVSANTNSGALSVRFGLGGGSTRQGTANTWSTSNVMGTSSMTNIMLTSGATWQVTGVQLEKGSVATSFDCRPFGTEFALCCRYFQKLVEPSLSGYAPTGTAVWRMGGLLPVQMRAAGTVTLTGSPPIQSAGATSLTAVGTNYSNNGNSIEFDGTLNASVSVNGSIVKTICSTSTTAINISSEL